MTKLDIMIDTPIGALMMVSGTITVFILLGILIMRKGTETHSVLGYLYFFGMGFANYASAMSFYEGLIPSSAIIISLPLSTIFLILGIIFIIPNKKNEFRIKAHVISMIVATVAFCFGIITKWYHFKISALDIFQWSDLRSIFTLSLPLLVIGVLSAIHFLSETQSIYLKYLTAEIDAQKDFAMEVELESPVPIVSSRRDSEIIYKKEIQAKESKLAQRG